MPKADWVSNTLPKIFDSAGLWPWKEGEVVSILDVACGLSLKSKFIPAQIRVGVDIYDKYFDHIESEVPYVVIKHDVRKLPEIFVPKSFDLVIALDVIEHLEKEESLAMIAECEKIARKAVILETPKGYIPQNLDILGHGGDTYQTHRCGWEPEELEKLGYKVVVRDYMMSNAKRHSEFDIDPSIQLMDAIKFV
ncbi:MAG: class I SAM-dependent methyltransferase [Parcubacteria group bacterium]